MIDKPRINEAARRRLEELRDKWLRDQEDYPVHSDPRAQSAAAAVRLCVAELDAILREAETPEPHWTHKHIKRVDGSYVAYDEAGMEHSRHNKHDEARDALVVYAATQLNKTKPSPSQQEAREALARLDKTQYATWGKGPVGYVCGDVRVSDLVTVVETFRRFIEQAGADYGPLLAPTDTAKEVFSTMLRDTPDADMRAVPNQWLLNERELTRNLGEDLLLLQQQAGAVPEGELVARWLDEHDMLEEAEKVRRMFAAAPKQEGE